MEIKITKKQSVYTQYNDMVSNEYWLVNGKVYNDDKTFSRRFKLVISFDIQDLQEYFDKDIISEQDKKFFVEMSAYSYCENINSFEDMKEFYKVCNETINVYNDMIRRIKNYSSSYLY